ncbi:EAL domain-containing protein [Halomonas koreensis]|uniref:EAL domain-containing protein n=1 Tax=Halomonas koreensis TaxID=245385 RepID=A0ABU1G285_9GAMM|nr:EAL domain-containing protein [Halomonas koreensis]MDR5867047.1 EAL domain-containing protein [Halomonas koreensis]
MSRSAKGWVGGLALLAVCLAAPLRADDEVLVVAPGEPGQRLDRRLIAELGDRLEARRGPGAMRVVYLGRGGSAALDAALAGGAPAGLLLLHDPAVAAYRQWLASDRGPGAERLAAYGAFLPGHRRWLRGQGAGHLDLLPVLLRHLGWVRHATGAARLEGWLMPGSPLLALQAVRREGEGRLEAVYPLDRLPPPAAAGTERVVLALPDAMARRRAAPLLAADGGVWCLQPEWRADGCLGGVQPSPSGSAEALLQRLASGGEATAPAAPRLAYAARHRVRPGVRDEVRYLEVPPEAMRRLGRGERLLFGALGLAVLAALALGVALAVERRRRRRRLRFGLDELTGLPGRPRLEARLRRHLEEGHAFQVCWIGFDRLDGVRAALGQAGIDEALRRIAKRLRRTARGEGYIARLEGEVFAVMSFLPVDADGRCPAGMAFARRLQDSLSAPFQVGREDRLLLPRIGVARCADDTTPFLVLEEAQAAARQVLRGGGRQPRVLAPAAVAPEERCLALVELLRRLPEERLVAQLAIDVEPRVLLADRRGCGGEIRPAWASLGWGRVEAAELVRVAELAGRRACLDRGLCERVLDVLARQADEAAPGPRSARRIWTVPVGLAQSIDAAFVEALSEACESRGLDPSRLELAVDSAELPREAALAPALRRCREAGFGIALTGLARSGASLAAIFRLPLTRLLLEPEIMARVPRDQSALLMLRSLRDTAKLAGRHLTVAGVATTEQLVALRGLGVVAAQGRLLGQAHPLEALGEGEAGPAPPGRAVEAQPSADGES